MQNDLSDSFVLTVMTEVQMSCMVHVVIISACFRQRGGLPEMIYLDGVNVVAYLTTLTMRV